MMDSPASRKTNVMKRRDTWAATAPNRICIRVSVLCERPARRSVTFQPPPSIIGPRHKRPRQVIGTMVDYYPQLIHVFSGNRRAYSVRVSLFP